MVVACPAGEVAGCSSAAPAAPWGEEPQHQTDTWGCGGEVVGGSSALCWEPDMGLAHGEVGREPGGRRPERTSLATRRGGGAAGQARAALRGPSWGPPRTPEARAHHPADRRERPLPALISLRRPAAAPRPGDRGGPDLTAPRRRPLPGSEPAAGARSRRRRAAGAGHRAGAARPAAGGEGSREEVCSPTQLLRPHRGDPQVTCQLLPSPAFCLREHISRCSLPSESHTCAF